MSTVRVGFGLSPGPGTLNDNILQSLPGHLRQSVLVMREVTERPEGVWARTVKLVGTDRERIFQEVRELMDNPASYQAMAQARNPYGDGQAANRIVQIIAHIFWLRQRADPL